jgi:hypothetical protein
MFEVQMSWHAWQWKGIAMCETLAQAVELVEFYRFGSDMLFRIVEDATGKVVSE